MIDDSEGQIFKLLKILPFFTLITTIHKVFPFLIEFNSQLMISLDLK